jgi:hypothetical protein
VESFKNSNLNFIRAFRRTPVIQFSEKLNPLQMTPPPYDLASVAVPDDTLALSAVKPALEQAGPRPVDGGKATTSASLSPDQRAREETIAKVSERRQHVRGGAASATTRPLDERHRRSRRARKIFPPRPRFGNPSSRPLPYLYKNPFDAVEKHTSAATDPRSSFFLSPSETSDMLQALTAVFLKIPAAVGAAVGARWRSRAAVELRH